MSDISLPPEPPKPGSKKLLERPVARALLTVLALTAPAPLMFALVGLWRSTIAPQEARDVDPFQLFSQVIDGTGSPPPVALLVVSVLLPALLIVIPYRKHSGMLIGMLLLYLVVSAGSFFISLQLIRG